MGVMVEPTQPSAHASLDSFEGFFRAEFAAVARTAGLIVRDPGVGEELAQEAFSRLYQRWSKMTSQAHARNFLYKVAINLGRSHLRKHRRVHVGSVPMGIVSDPSTMSADLIAVARALEGLSSRQRACVVLIDYAGHDARSAAQILRTSESTVRVHLFRARRALREALQESENPDE